MLCHSDHRCPPLTLMTPEHFTGEDIRLDLQGSVSSIHPQWHKQDVDIEVFSAQKVSHIAWAPLNTRATFHPLPF